MKTVALSCLRIPALLSESSVRMEDSGTFMFMNTSTFVRELCKEGRKWHIYEYQHFCLIPLSGWKKRGTFVIMNTSTFVWDVCQDSEGKAVSLSCLWILYQYLCLRALSGWKKMALSREMYPSTVTQLPRARQNVENAFIFTRARIFIPTTFLQLAIARCSSLKANRELAVHNPRIIDDRIEKSIKERRIGHCAFAASIFKVQRLRQY